MSEKVSTSLAAQLHNHALTSSEAATTVASCHHVAAPAKETAQQQQQQQHQQPLQFEMDGPAAAISAQLNFKIMPADSLPGLSYQEMFASMNTSQISNASTESSCSPPSVGIGCGPPKPARHMAVQPMISKSCRFPKLEECAHFHYERVQLGALSVQLLDDKSEQLSNSIASQSIGGDVAHNSLRSFSPESCWFIIRVCPQRCEPFLIKRSFENMQMLDEMLHRCVYDRKISGLRNMSELEAELPSESDVEYAVAKYLERFSKIASDSLTCGTVLTWLQLDNKGRRLPLADGETQRTINTPAVGAAYGVRRYQAQAPDEINIEVGDMISVIDMPSPAESVWWRGKKSHLQKSHYEVGFFPQSCVATIGDKVPRNFPMPAPLVGHLDSVSPTKPVLRKHGKLIAFFRSFILSRPSRRRLKQSGIYRERVFNCDLSEHLLNSGQDIPMVLKSCAEFIENYGVIDGIYRLSGITSNIQRLRRSFDEERVPDLGNPEMKQDIHAVSSLLKMYFRELPNPLCTYQLYDNFVEAIQVKADEADERLRLMKETVLKLPPPHYRTLKYLAEHLFKVSQHHERTGMTDKNLAIVWAPNLLRSPALESGGVAALRGVGVQAVVTEYLIRNCHNIFDAIEDHNAARLSVATAAGAGTGIGATGELRLESLTDCESLLVEQREQDQSLTVVERPKSLSTGGAKLISLEEAQERHSRIEATDLKQSLPISMLSSTSNAATNIGSYIEVGGGPSSLPDKYHTVLSAPRSWQKRKPDKTPSWKSIFTRSQRQGSVDPGQKLVGPHDAASAGGGGKEPSSSRVNFVQASHAHASKELSKLDKPKSIELLETTHEMRESKPMELCIRSNSIDSLRTVGHSRSVSHDSYFDLLQSPQRGHMTTCPSRELSELGLNFDREEPEMRIFSESESLVSSPRVGKENVPPASGCATRRIMRARPEEFSSQTNSVNPSPKKQPRLNLLSPSTARSLPHATSSNASGGGVVHTAAANAPCGHEPAGAENCCKRYKLEDQLSDIQFIDCGTPEHAPTTQQQFASVEVHSPPPPKPARAANHHSAGVEAPLSASLTTAATPANATTRYSYPQVQLGAKRKEKQVAKERFSYPGTNNETQPNTIPPRPKHNHATPPLRSKPRIETSEDSQVKLTVPTPTTPAHSPRYSLLLCDTEESSENSSAVNTPQYDMEPLMLTSAMSGISGVSSNMQQQLLLGVDATGGSSYLGSSYESIGQHFNNLQDVEHRDMNALKRELSLDLQPLQPTRQSQTVNNNRAATLPVKEQLQTAAAMCCSSPNNSNFTDNTSQSVTPSEFGYQHLQRQLSMHSLLATEESSPVYEDFEQTPSNTFAAAGPQKLLASPIKSTISITYKSPEKEKPPLLNEKPSTLLETNFDENIVYEQVKLFRNSVTEVNQMLNERHSLKQIEEEEHDGGASKAAEMTQQLLDLEEQQHQLLYENIELRKPQTVYENLRGEEMKVNTQNDTDTETTKTCDRIELDSLESLPDNNTLQDEHESLQEQQQMPEEETMAQLSYRKSPSFSVKELANKFESSPVEQLPSFDFSLRGGSMKKPNELSVPKPINAGLGGGGGVGSGAVATVPASLKKLNNAQKITRSLDENAFVREFGGKQLQDLSVNKLPEMIMPDLNNRRKSFDFTRPKTLNPPKRLPGMSITEEICQKREQITPTTENRISLIQQNNIPKETSAIITTSTPVSLPQQPPLGVPPPSNSGRKSVLTGVILDRERIDKIKEERRQQLTQKYYGDTLKSRSKTELNSEDNNFQTAESLRIKSKSRGDVHTLQKDMDMNLKQLSRVAAAGSESTLNTGDYATQHHHQQQQQHHHPHNQRVRRISDEKNQNCDTNNGGISTTLLSVKSAAQKYDTNKAAATAAAATVAPPAAITTTTTAPGKFERASLLPSRDRGQRNSLSANESNASVNNREKISPQFSIRDVTAMFESRSQNQ